MPLRSNCRSVAIGSNPIFCRSAVVGQPISVLVTLSLCIPKDVSSISVLACNGNGSYRTVERQRNGGNQALGLLPPPRDSALLSRLRAPSKFPRMGYISHISL